MEIIVKNEDELGIAARKFIDEMGENKHFAFLAPMGAGKTTFISAICREMGVKDDISSPTFSIVNQYYAGDGTEVCHFDFYRIENDTQAADLGLEEYFDSDALCLMEWPENVEYFLPDDTQVVRIEVLNDNSRKITF